MAGGFTPTKAAAFCNRVKRSFLSDFRDLAIQSNGLAGVSRPIRAREARNAMTVRFRFPLLFNDLPLSAMGVSPVSP